MVRPPHFPRHRLECPINELPVGRCPATENCRHFACPLKSGKRWSIAPQAVSVWGGNGGDMKLGGVCGPAADQPPPNAPQLGGHARSSLFPLSLSLLFFSPFSSSQRGPGPLPFRAAWSMEGGGGSGGLGDRQQQQGPGRGPPLRRTVSGGDLSPGTTTGGSRSAFVSSCAFGIRFMIDALTKVVL